MRIKLTIPNNQMIHKIDIEVRITDLNYGGHLANDKVLTLCHQARVKLLNSKGFSEMDIHGAGIIMADSAIQYKSEAFYGDIITISMHIDGLSKRGFDLYYKLTNKESDKEVAIVKTAILFFNYEKKKLCSIANYTDLL